MMKILMPARDIPLEATVTKRGGEKEYVLRDRLRIFGEDGKPKELRAEEGTRLLVASNGDANVVAGNTELIWQADEDEVRMLLDTQ